MYSQWPPGGAIRCLPYVATPLMITFSLMPLILHVLHHYDRIILSWMYDTIFGELLDVVREPS